MLSRKPLASESRSVAFPDLDQMLPARRLFSGLGRGRKFKNRRAVSLVRWRAHHVLSFRGLPSDRHPDRSKRARRRVNNR
jgi:hypothetical protein